MQIVVVCAALPVICALGAQGVNFLVRAQEFQLKELPETSRVYRVGGSFICLLGLIAYTALGAWVWTM